MYPYALGIAYYKRKKYIHQIFYLSDYKYIKLDRGISMMFEDFKKYILTHCKDRILYVHNLGNFDGYLILKNLESLTPIDNILIDDENAFIRMYLREAKIWLYDSHRILPLSLRELSVIFNVEYPKLEFNHSEININNFNLKKEEISIYLKHDLLALLEIIIKSSEFLFKTFHINMRGVLSTSSLAMRVFRTNYLDKEGIPVLHDLLDKKIRPSYKGGMVYINKIAVKEAYHYDVNSLYPKAMTLDMPYKYLGIVNGKNIELDTFFGFLQVEVSCNRNFERPFLPTKIKSFNGEGIVAPTGVFSDIFFS